MSWRPETNEPAAWHLAQAVENCVEQENAFLDAVDEGLRAAALGDLHDREAVIQELDEALAATERNTVR